MHSFKGLYPLSLIFTLTVLVILPGCGTHIDSNKQTNVVTEISDDVNTEVNQDSALSTVRLDSILLVGPPPNYKTNGKTTGVFSVY